MLSQCGLLSVQKVKLFNEELGQLTLLSYPVIAIPSMVMMMIFYYLCALFPSLTGLALDDVLASKGLKNEKYD